jgi:hypothetical protein
MTRFLMMSVLAGILTGTLGCRRPSDSSATQAQAKTGAIEYFQAGHGFNGGLSEMVDLSQRAGFDAIRTLDELAKFASAVPGAVGFTAHPYFEKGERSGSAVMWYTKLSPAGSSQSLYLFNKNEAQKKPGDAPQAAAVAAAEAKVSGQMGKARGLIAAGGATSVKLAGDYHERKVVALAVLRLGGRFAHSGAFDVGHCATCRSVVPSYNPSSCDMDVQNRKHWNCCGSTSEGGYCEYWKQIKAQDDGKY